MGYHVTDTREILRTTQGGGQVSVYRVWMTTNRGASGMVDVSVDDWTSERLAEILTAKAEQLDLAFSVAGED